MNKHRWADKYGSRWYLHYDGRPPHDDDNDYIWTGTQWVTDNENDNLDLEEFEENRRQRIALQNEY